LPDMLDGHVGDVLGGDGFGGVWGRLVLWAVVIGG